MTPRDRRALRWGGTVVLGSLLVLRVLPWVVAEVSGRLRTLDEERAQLRRIRVELAELPALEGEARVVTQRIAALAPHLLPAASSADASASMAGELSHLAIANRLLLDQVVPILDSVSAGDLRRTTAVATLVGDVDGVMGLMKALLLSNVVIVPSRLRVVGTDPGAGARGPERLHIELEVRAWYLPKRVTPP